jgi:signal transduction histidine kinase
MNAASHGELEGVTAGFADDSSLVVAAAHELSSPLVLLRQLSLGALQSSEAERRVLNERLTLVSERALRMVASLSLTATNQQQLQLEPINPVSVCREVVHELAPLFAAHGQTLKVRPRARMPLLVGDRQLLRQILLSFADNALFYGSKQHPIAVNITERRGSVRIGVRDFGPAVPMNLWQLLDERLLQRARLPLAARPHASAVSLVAAKRLAEMMGSTVGVTRHRDGATFYVDLRVSGQMSLL